MTTKTVSKERKGGRARAAALLLAIGSAVLFSSSASAHLGAPEGRFPFITSEGLIGGGTTWGIVRKEGERWLRVCEESIEEPPPFYYRRSDGRLLVARSDGLWLTDDGCSLDPGDPTFTDRRPSLLAVPHDERTTLFVATSLSTGGNGLYVSEDEGQTFAPTGLVDQDVSFRSLIASDDGQDVYLGGISLDSRAPVVFVSRDGGESFTAKAPWGETVVTANLVGRDPKTGEVALVLLDSESTGSTLALVDEAFEGLTPLATFAGVVSDFVVHDDAWLVIESRQRYFRRAKSEAEFVLIDDGPTRCLLKQPGDERVWGCGQPFQNGHFLVSDDGVTFTPEMLFFSVEEQRCPEGTIGALRCAYLWEGDGPVVEPKPEPGGGGGGGGRVERPAEEVPEGSSCSGAGGGDASLLFLFALVGGLSWPRRFADGVRAPSSWRPRPC